MSNELMMDSGPYKLKFIVLGGIVLTFAAIVLVLVRPGKSDAVKSASARATPAVQVARAASPPVIPPPAMADAVQEQAAPSADPSRHMTNAGMPTDTASAPSTADMAAVQTASPAPAAPGPSEPIAPAPSADTEPAVAMDAAPSVDIASAAAQPRPRSAVRPPAPPALDALHAWWRDAAAHDFSVQYVGQAAGEDALVFRFSKSIADSTAAAQHISITAENGTVISGNWKTGGNPYVLVYQGVKPGRYLVRIDPELASAGGNKLGEPLQGAVYVQ